MARGGRGRRAFASLILGVVAILVGLWWLVVHEPERKPDVHMVASPDAAPPQRPIPRPRFPRSAAADDDAGQVILVPAARTDALRSIGGVVVRADGSPVPGAEVAYGSNLQYAGGRLLGEGRVTTGPQGHFRFDAESNKGVSVAATHSTEGWSKVELVHSGGGPVDDLRLRLEAPAAIEGRVLHRGAPVPGARLMLGSDRLGVQVLNGVSDDAGGFRFAPVAAGPYHLSASVLPPEIGDGSAWSNVPVSPGAGETARVDVELPGGVYLLVNASELPDGALTYQIFAGAVATGAPIQELPMGRVRGRAVAFRDLEPGLYTVCATVLGETPRCVGAELGASPPLQSAEIH